MTDDPKQDLSVLTQDQFTELLRNYAEAWRGWRVSDFLTEAVRRIEADASATSAEKDAEIARLTHDIERHVQIASDEATRAEAAEAEAAALREHSHRRGEDIRKLSAEAAALRERLERASKQIEYALTKASLSAPEKISDALSLARALQNKEQANG